MAQQAKSFFLGDDIYAYLRDQSNLDDDLLRALADETRALGPISGMQIAPEQGAFMTILVRAIGARRAVEVGTFTGYSAICIARGLSPDGHLLCCDVNEEWGAIARSYWARAGLEDRIELRLAPATETLRSLPLDDPIDIAFIDADKPSYPTYYDELLPRVRPNGFILVDNVLQRGHVIDPDSDNENVLAIQRFNERLRGDSRIDFVMLPVSDGLTVIRKR